MGILLSVFGSTSVSESTTIRKKSPRSYNYSEDESVFTEIGDRRRVERDFDEMSGEREAREDKYRFQEERGDRKRASRWLPPDGDHSRFDLGRETDFHNRHIREIPSYASSTQRRERIPDPFVGGKSDLNDWLCHFNTVAKSNCWNEFEKGTNLAMSLRGSALQVLRDLSAYEREDYECILRALRRRFDPGEQEPLRRMEFRSRIKKKDETVTEFGFSLSRLAISAYPNMSPEAREILVIDQFIAGLQSRDLKRHVQFKHPSSLHEAISLAREYESFEGRFDGRKPDDNGLPIRGINGEEKAVEEKLLSAFQKMVEKVETVLERAGLQNRRPKDRFDDKHKKRDGPIQCYNCQEYGHISTQCDNPAKPRSFNAKRSQEN